MRYTPLDGPFVGRHDPELIPGQVQRDVVAVDHRGGKQVIEWNVEEALYGTGVHVHGDYAIGAGVFDEVGDQLGRDGHTPHVLAILPSISVVGNDRRDATGGCPFEAVDH